MRSLKYADAEKISGNKVKQAVTVRTGVEQELAKKIVRLVKDSKLKVQASIQGDAVRVSGAKQRRPAGRRSRSSRSPSPTFRCSTRTSATDRGVAVSAAATRSIVHAPARAGPLDAGHATAMFAGMSDPQLFRWLDDGIPPTAAALAPRYARIAPRPAPARRTGG